MGDKSESQLCRVANLLVGCARAGKVQLVYLVALITREAVGRINFRAYRGFLSDTSACHLAAPCVGASKVCRGHPGLFYKAQSRQQTSFC
jgi:hypothetical protein